MYFTAFLLFYVFTVDSSLSLFPIWTVSAAAVTWTFTLGKSYLTVVISHLIVHPQTSLSTSSCLSPQVWLLHTGSQPALQTQTCPLCRGWGWEDKFLLCCVVSGNCEVRWKHWCKHACVPAWAYPRGCNMSLLFSTPLNTLCLFTIAGVLFYFCRKWGWTWRPATKRLSIRVMCSSWLWNPTSSPSFWMKLGPTSRTVIS